METPPPLEDPTALEINRRLENRVDFASELIIWNADMVLDYMIEAYRCAQIDCLSAELPPRFYTDLGYHPPHISEDNRRGIGAPAIDADYEELASYTHCFASNLHDPDFNGDYKVAEAFIHVAYARGYEDSYRRLAWARSIDIAT